MIKNYALKLTSRYIYSEKRLREKIKDKFGEFDGLEKIISWLKEYGAIDDEKNREFIVNNLKEKGYGAKYIKLYLKKRGFKNDLNIENQEEDIRKWFEKKIKQERKPFDRKKIARIFRYLQSKGFTSEEIISFLKKEGMYERERD